MRIVGLGKPEARFLKRINHRSAKEKMLLTSVQLIVTIVAVGVLGWIKPFLTTKVSMARLRVF
jgi:hypothetical protein